MIFCSTDRLVPCQVVVRKVSASSRWKRVQSPPQNIMQRESKLEVSIGLLTSKIWEYHRRRGGKTIGVRGWRTTGECGPPNQLCRVYLGSQRLKRQARGLYGSVQGPLLMLWLLPWCSCETPNSDSRCISDPFVCS